MKDSSLSASWSFGSLFYRITMISLSIRQLTMQCSGSGQRGVSKTPFWPHTTLNLPSLSGSMYGWLESSTWIIKKRNLKELQVREMLIVWQKKGTLASFSGVSKFLTKTSTTIISQSYLKQGEGVLFSSIIQNKPNSQPHWCTLY